ncbi:MAG TPA: RluA family pseudouridine synthase [Cyclobacteriaceae bacterium]|nr:RluA family pseudouridine synthase [Cyclobacteriaceae bacterium]HOO09020.1 RluA family pseudouridine synthase [Cyclobacteriaceae bacterium]
MDKRNAIKVLYEDNHLLVVDKPVGVLVQGDATGDEPLVEMAKRYIKIKYGKPGAVFLGVVHRLDRPVSGVVAFARTSKALARMNALFKNREIKKTYWAIVGNRPPANSGRLLHWLVKDEKKNKVTAYPNEHPGGKRSELAYKTMARQGPYHLLEVDPVTGRGHQIRVQLASMGCAIIGDVKYGSPAPNGDGGICLHAKMLGFAHPVTKVPLGIEAAIPESGAWGMFC